MRTKRHWRASWIIRQDCFSGVKMTRLGVFGALLKVVLNCISVAEFLGYCPAYSAQLVRISHSSDCLHSTTAFRGAERSSCVVCHSAEVWSRLMSSKISVCHLEDLCYRTRNMWKGRKILPSVKTVWYISGQNRSINLFGCSILRVIVSIGWHVRSCAIITHCSSVFSELHQFSCSSIPWRRATRSKVLDKVMNGKMQRTWSMTSSFRRSQIRKCSQTNIIEYNVLMHASTKKIMNHRKDRRPRKRAVMLYKLVFLRPDGIEYSCESFFQALRFSSSCVFQRSIRHPRVAWIVHHHSEVLEAAIGSNPVTTLRSC